MNTAAYSAQERSGALTGLISRLAAAERAIELPADKTGRIESILRRINETVLPRGFALTSEEGVLAYLVVSGRRLMAAIPGGETTGTGEVSDVVTILSLVCETSGTLSVKNEGRPDDMADPDSGISVASLRRELGGLHSGSGVAVLAALAGSDALAVLRHDPDGTETGRDGDEHSCAGLAAVVSAQNFNPDAGSGAAAAGVLIPADDETSILALADDTGSIAALLKRDTALSVMSGWQDLMSARSD